LGTDKIINDLKQIEGFNNGYVELNNNSFVKDPVKNIITQIKK
jgi:hypothetical protein